MQPSNEELLNVFENEIWLYIDNSLPQQRMNYWKRQLEKNLELQEFYENTKHVLSIYNDHELPEMPEKNFNKIVRVAVKSKHIYSSNFINDVLDFLHTLFFEDAKKVSFAAGLVIVIIVILFQFKQPHTISGTETYSLDWNADIIERRISKVEKSLHAVKNQNSVDYAIYQYTKDQWNAARTIIKDQINSIKHDIDNKSL